MPVRRHAASTTTAAAVVVAAAGVSMPSADKLKYTNLLTFKYNYFFTGNIAPKKIFLILVYY
jgi:hypothetical protein